MSFGFLFFVFTNDAFVDITENLNFAKSKMSCCILLDVKEAFVTIDDERLLVNVERNSNIDVALHCFAH